MKKELAIYLGEYMNCREDYKRWQFNYRFYQRHCAECRVRGIDLEQLEQVTNK